MGYFSHGHSLWKSLESTRGEDQQLLFLIQDSFLTQNVSNEDILTNDLRITVIDDMKVSEQYVIAASKGN